MSSVLEKQNRNEKSTIGISLDDPHLISVAMDAYSFGVHLSMPAQHSTAQYYAF